MMALMRSLPKNLKLISPLAHSSVIHVFLKKKKIAGNDYIFCLFTYLSIENKKNNDNFLLACFKVHRINDLMSTVGNLHSKINDV